MLLKIAEKVQARKATKTGWWAKVITGVLIAVVVVGFLLKLWLRRGESVAVRTQKVLAENAARREKAKAQIEALDASQTKALVKATIAEQTAQRHTEKLERIEEADRQEKEILKRIKSWEDVDRYVR